MLGGTVRAPRSTLATQPPPARRIRPSSIIIETICSTKSGLPWAASMIRRRGPAASAISPSRPLTTSALSASLRGRSAMVVARGRSSRQPGRSSSSSGREVQRTTSAASSPFSATWAIRSRKVGSAQWMSSITVTTGPPRATISSSRRAAQKVSWTGWVASESPITDASRSATSAASSPSRPVSRARAWSAGSFSAMPAASRAISASGQKVIPSP